MLIAMNTSTATRRATINLSPKSSLKLSKMAVRLSTVTRKVSKQRLLDGMVEYFDKSPEELKKLVQNEN